MITDNEFISEVPKFSFRFRNMSEKAIKLRITEKEIREKYDKKFLALMEARGVIVNCAVEIESLLKDYFGLRSGDFNDKIQKFSDLMDKHKVVISNHWDVSKTTQELNDLRDFRNDLAHGTFSVNEKDEFHVQNRDRLRPLTREEFDKNVKISNELFHRIASINSLVKMAEEGQNPLDHL